MKNKQNKNDIKATYKQVDFFKLAERVDGFILKHVLFICSYQL